MMFHTPLCPKDCNITHHDVIIALQAVAPRFSSSTNDMNAASFGIFSPSRVTRGNNKEDFKKHVQKLVSNGWYKDEDVPETSQVLRFPLLHLASMFGKHEIVEWLLNDEDYDANLKASKSNETALHLVARHLYTALSLCESRLENMSITAKVANFERIVSLLINKEVSLFWAKDSLNRETTFHILAKQLLQAASADVGPETEDHCLSFYAKSFDVILKLLLAEEGARLSRKDVKHTLSIKNSEGDTALHILAKATHQGFLVLRFLVKVLGNNDLLKIKNSNGHSAMDIVNQVYPGRERELLVDEEAKKKARVSTSGTQTTGRKQMDLIQVLQKSNTNATGSVVGSHTESQNVPEGQCAIHTPSFPGLCSPDCYDIMAAVGTLVNTHTPLCPTGCDLRHHLLTSAVFSPSVMIRTYSDDCLPVTFKLCIQGCFSAGWERDMDVPDPLESLRYPLLHLICMSGNCIALAKLIQEMKFTLCISRRNKETPLHVAARYFPVAYPDSRISSLHKMAKFQGILNLLIDQDDDILFMVNTNGDTVMHVLARCFCATSNLVLKNCGSTSTSNHRSTCLMKQKHCYFKAMKLVIETLADLVQRERVCKKAVCKVVCHPKEKHATETFWDILRAGPDKVILRVLTVYAHDMLPFCFGNARHELLHNLCEQSCPCEGSADLQSRGCQTQPCQIEGENPVQEPVSSTGSPSVSVEHRNTNISESQPNPARVAPAESPSIVQVVHTPLSPARRPQAQVQSIQLQGQAAMAGNPSLQTTAVAPSAQHIPVVVIKQEPPDLQLGTQYFYSVNNHVVGPSQKQNAFIFQPASAIATVGPNQLPIQAMASRSAGQPVVSMLQQPLPPSPSQLQSSRPGSQGVTPALSGREQALGVSNQPTTDTPQQCTQTTSQIITPPQSQRGNTATQPKKQMLQRSAELPEKRKSGTVEEFVAETWNNITDASYRTDILHTPLCDVLCRTNHHHLILTMYSTSNRKNSKGKNAFAHLLEASKTNFLNCLKKCLDEGMTKDLDMNDGLVKLRYPLVHLAGMFFKYCAIEILGFLGFNRNVRSPRTGEFPLHSVLHNNYETGQVVYKTISQPGFVDQVFSRVFDCLSSGFDLVEILSQQDRNGDTPLHVAAKKMTERPVSVTKPSVVAAKEIPDSTQGSDTGSSEIHQPPTDSSPVKCSLAKATKEQQAQAEFYTKCMWVMYRRLAEFMKNRKRDFDLVIPVFFVKNNDGKTFLDILCKEHHLAAFSITTLLSRFPLDVLRDCARKYIPKSCWPNCIPAERSGKQVRVFSQVQQTDLVSRSVESSEMSKKQTAAHPSKPESPKPSSDASVVQASPTTSTTTPMETDAQGANSTPVEVPATPLQNEMPGSVTDNMLDAVLSPVVANPTHATLRPNTKRKIIDALKEDYSERLELAVKGRHEVEEDILKHKLKTRELTEVMAKKKEVMEKLEKEMQELQKELWHKNQAIQALESSLEQFTKEEEEMHKNLAVLQSADPEPPAKRNKTSSEVDTRL